MNIFVLHENPRIAAQMHCDRHCTKMCVEYAQLLCFAHYVANKDKKWVERNVKFKLNKGHASHPCTLWMLEDPRHYAWVYRLLQELLAEYDYRYNGLIKGKYANIIKMLPALARIPNTKLKVDDVKRRPDYYTLAMGRAPECMGEYAVESYRRFYLVNKRAFATWKRRETPQWFTSGIRQLNRVDDIQLVTVV